VEGNKTPQQILTGSPLRCGVINQPKCAIGLSESFTQVHNYRKSLGSKERKSVFAVGNNDDKRVRLISKSQH